MCLNYWFAISATVAFTSLISYGDKTRIVIRFLVSSFTTGLLKWGTVHSATIKKSINILYE